MVEEKISKQELKSLLQRAMPEDAEQRAFQAIGEPFWRTARIETDHTGIFKFTYDPEPVASELGEFFLQLLTCANVPQIQAVVDRKGLSDNQVFADEEVAELLARRDSELDQYRWLAFELWLKQVQPKLKAALEEHLMEVKEQALRLLDGQTSLRLPTDAKELRKTIQQISDASRRQRVNAPGRGRKQDWAGTELDKKVPQAMALIKKVDGLNLKNVVTKLNEVNPHKKPFPSGVALRRKVDRDCSMKFGEMINQDKNRRNSVPANLSKGMVKG